MSRLDRCYNVADLRAAAMRRLPKGIFETIDKGAEDQIALGNNRRAFESLKMRNRVLVDVSDVKLDTQILGKPTSLPLAIAPTGVAGLCWYEGELELAKAAAKAGVPFALATASNTSMEKIAKEAGGRLWFQLYMWRDKEASYELVRRAAAAGYETLIWTVDLGHGSNREHNARNGFSTPYKSNFRSAMDVLRHPAWLGSVLGRYLATGGMPEHANYPEKYRTKLTGVSSATKALRADKVSWSDVDRLRELWPGKLLIKGILHPDDATEALNHGVDGLIVSNHGGRNLDSADASLDVLPEIVAAVGGKMTIGLDSGIRRGSDIVKAIGLGAHFVLTGRATLYGIAAGGQAGAEKSLAFLKDEMRRTMAYVGRQRVGELGKDLFVPRSSVNAFRS